MRPADEVKFVEILNGLAAVKPGSGGKLTKEAIKLWWNSMRDWSIEDFQRAANHLADSVEFMPNPYHFAQLRRAGIATPDEAWTTALANCKSWREGASKAGELIDSVVATIGGYRTIALADDEKVLPHIQRRFLDAYRQRLDVEPARVALPEIAKPIMPRIGARPPVHIAHVAAQMLTPAPAPAVLPAPARNPEPSLSAQHRVESLLRVPGLSDEDIARTARVSIEIVRQVRASLESAA